MSRPCSTVVVVLVDDEQSFRVGVAANLEDDGHRVGVYADPREVLPAVIAAADVVVTDYQMAEVDGLTFADAVHKIKPDISVVLATAYWTVEIETAVVARRFVRLCRKPMDYEELHALIHELAGE